MIDNHSIKPIVAIVGRPNVGKSTLFNRITRSKNALVDNFPGITRDRNYGAAVWDDVEFTLVDTGGFISGDDDFENAIRLQTLQAVEDANVIILVLDGKKLVSPFDKDVVAMLRLTTKPVFYVINKIDGIEQEVNCYEFYNLGVDKMYPVSAEHGYGISDFLDNLTIAFPKNISERPPDMIKLAVIGRPNVGKSSLVNRMLGENRLLVSDIPGTTRDSIDSMCQNNGTSYLIIDTAGIRRKGKTYKKIEKFSVIKALRSIDRCDVALIVIDAYENVTDQDINIAGYAFERGRGCVLLLNKWDLIKSKDNKTIKQYYEQLAMKAKYLNFAPVITISALTGLRLSNIFTIAEKVHDQYATRIETHKLNTMLKNALEENEPPLHKGKRLKFYYCAQVSVKPVVFVCFVNYPEGVHFSYKRYLINQIRLRTGLDKIPIRIIFRRRTGRIEFGKHRKKT